MRADRVHTAGAPEDVLTAANVRAVLGLDRRVIVDPTSGKPLMLPIGRRHTIEPAEPLVAAGRVP